MIAFPICGGSWLVTADVTESDTAHYRILNPSGVKLLGFAYWPFIPTQDQTALIEGILRRRDTPVQSLRDDNPHAFATFLETAR